MSVCSLHQVKQNAKWKVRCLAQYHNLIFAGCSDQYLRIFAPYQRAAQRHAIEYQGHMTWRWFGLSLIHQDYLGLFRREENEAAGEIQIPPTRLSLGIGREKASHVFYSLDSFDMDVEIEHIAI